MSNCFSRFALVLCVALSAGCRDSTSAAGGSTSRADAYPVADATVTGPITGGLHGHALWDSWYDVAELGYVEEEFFISGKARVQPDGDEADYTTRIIVTRPTDPARFNGTVFMEWVNVTAQFENAVDITEAHDFLLREGYAYVHVSAQSAGLCCVPELTPKLWDPLRYQPISHPGDDWSFDMFAQIAKALRAPAATDPMGGLKVQKIIAGGQSQSASRLYSYVNLGYARSGVIDGFLIHGGGSKIFDEPPAVPVLHLHSDREADPENPGTHTNFALWEVGGSSHTDLYVGYHQVAGQSLRITVDQQRPASADPELHDVASNYGEVASPLLDVCIVAGSAFPMRYAVKAALWQLDNWVRTGQQPPDGPRFALDESGALTSDEHGNTLGGIRYPVVDVPIARYASTVCPLGGITIPFSASKIAELYPTHAEYWCKLKAAADRTRAEGFLLAEDEAELLARADAAAGLFPEAGTKSCN